ncbi:MAG: hypothetical protein HQK51_08755 [Oligoflexia bacterium]|nr:hypothetical protein [Oligoflexia bacterium]
MNTNYSQIKSNSDLNKIAPKYKKILEKTKPYILTYSGNLPHYNLSPWGHDTPKENIFSCIDARHARFFDLLQSLDQLSFGPVGMPMDKWVFFDCGEMPGGVYGFGVHAWDLSKEVQEKYKIDDSYKGLIPISMYIAIPMANGDWFGHNLSSVSTLLGDDFKGLGLLTKAMGIKVYNIKNLYGATQWESKSLNIHLQLSDMELRSAYTPAHSFNKTITYKSFYSDQGLINSLSGDARKAKSWDMLVDVMDDDFIIDLQNKIEFKGERYLLVGRPEYRDNKVLLPIKKL